MFPDASVVAVPVTMPLLSRYVTFPDASLVALPVALILIDTGKDSENGSLVVAKLTDSNEATFKKLVIDGGNWYLKGLNPTWPVMKVNGDCKIIGVTVQMMMKL